MIINANIAYYALQQITEGNEDFVYNRFGKSCYYQVGGRPSCGVGKALAFLGMTSEDLIYMDQTAHLQGIRHVQLPNSWYITKYARNVFGEFQDLQDHGDSWGAALFQAGQKLVSNKSVWSFDG